MLKKDLTKKNDYKGLAILTMGVVLAFGSLAQAQEVKFTGEACPLQVTTGEGEEEKTEEKTVKSLQIFGLVEEGETSYAYVQLPGNVTGYVDAAELAEKIPALDMSALPSVSEWQDLTQGSSGEDVKAAQEALQKAGVLDGEADGMYGSGTAAAVSEWQTQENMEATGTVNLNTFFMLVGGADETEPIETSYPPVYDPAEKFAAIYDSAADQSALDDYLDPSWKFSYDVFEGEGRITRNEEIGTWEDETGRAIDRLSLTAGRLVYVQREDNGQVNLIPAFEISTTGAYRPYVQSILLRKGNQVAEMPALFARGSLDGTSVQENAIVPLTEEAQALLEDETAGKEAVLRIKGVSHSYDLTFTS